MYVYVLQYAVLKFPTAKTVKRQGLTGEPVRTNSPNEGPFLSPKPLKPKKNVCQFLFVSFLLV